MRFLTIKNVKPGLRTGKPIVNSKGVILVNTNGIISERAIAYAKESGMQGFYVNDDISSDVTVNDIIPDECRGILMTALFARDVLSLSEGADMIIDNVNFADLKTVSLIEAKNLQHYTLKHSIATAIFSVVLGKTLKLAQDQLKNLCMAALLMDVGKLDMIERKEDRGIFHSEKNISEYASERECIKKHARRSYEIVSEDNHLTSVTKNAILFSHENPDGSGYYGYKAEQIHILPRILRVADIYDAMTSRRRNRDAYSPAEAIEYIMGEAAAGRLDMDICNTLRDTFPAYGIGFTVLLDNHAQAIVVSLQQSMLRPIIRELETGRDIDLSRQLDRTIVGIL